MDRHDLLLILVGAVATVLGIAALGFARALMLRRRRKRQAAEAWRVALPLKPLPALPHDEKRG